MTFGIPTRVLPLTDEGEVLIENHLQWLEQQRNREKMATGNDGLYRVCVPGPLDVLLGREKSIQVHRGNIRYNQVIADHLERYNDAPRMEKTYITHEVIECIQSTGGRFLRQDKAGWVEVDIKIAREKVSNAFRSKRKTRLGGSKSISGKNTENRRRSQVDDDSCSTAEKEDTNKGLDNATGLVPEGKRQKFVAA